MTDEQGRLSIGATVTILATASWAGFTVAAPVGQWLTSVLTVAIIG